MNKKLLAVLIAGLLLLTAASCGKKDSDKDKETLPPVQTTADGETVGSNEIVTDGQGNVVTEAPAETLPPEPNPVFAEKTMKVVVFTWSAKLRSSTDLSTDDNVIHWPTEGAVLDVTGESETWYRVTYNEKEAYIRKSVAADAAALDGFTAINDTVTTNGVSNIRSYPSADTDSIRGQATKDATLTRVAVGGDWSKVLFTVKDKDGKDVEKEYYIHNSCLVTPESETTDGSESAATTEAESVTETEGETAVTKE